MHGSQQFDHDHFKSFTPFIVQGQPNGQAAAATKSEQTSWEEAAKNSAENDNPHLGEQEGSNVPHNLLVFLLCHLLAANAPCWKPVHESRFELNTDAAQFELLTSQNLCCSQ